MSVILGYNYDKWNDAGIKSSIRWDMQHVPHALIGGSTGSGKSICCQYIVNQLLEQKKDIWIADFKAGGDWDGITDNYAEYIDCNDLFTRFYLYFCETIKQKKRADSFLIFDEFSSFILRQDSKSFKEVMAKLSHLAFMSRAFGFHLILISQQWNSKIIDTAIREQFGVKIHISPTISTESAAMLFPGADIDKSLTLPIACGYISMPEIGLGKILIPFIEKPERLKQLLINKGSYLRKKNFFNFQVG